MIIMIELEKNTQIRKKSVHKNENTTSELISTQYVAP